MPLRAFSDMGGRQWTAWATIPDWRAGVSEELRGGWLTFECAGIRKRLSPVPPDWEEAPLEQLLKYCALALPVARRRGVRGVKPRG